jgi:hypothetical protein
LEFVVFSAIKLNCSTLAASWSQFAST